MSGPLSTPPEVFEYREGDRCEACGYWYWERDGVGWHSLVPITYADHPGQARLTVCPSCDAFAAQASAAYAAGKERPVDADLGAGASTPHGPPPPTDVGLRPTPPDGPRIRSAVFAALLYVDAGESLASAVELAAESRNLSKVEAEQVRALVVLHVSPEKNDV